MVGLSTRSLSRLIHLPDTKWTQDFGLVCDHGDKRKNTKNSELVVVVLFRLFVALCASVSAWRAYHKGVVITMVTLLY